MPQYLTLEDIRLARDPERLLTLLPKPVSFWYSMNIEIVTRSKA
jgi:hypothetical protein